MSYRFVSIFLLTVTFVAGVAVAQAADYLNDAESLAAKGELRAAEIQLKNAVRSDPKNMVAHYRLALLQLQLGEAAAAEHEARTAQAGGYDPERTVPLLAQTYLPQQKYRQLLEDFPATNGSKAERAGVLVARGYAQVALGQRDDARQSFQNAQTLAPDAPEPILAEAKLLMSERQFAAAEPLVDHAVQLDQKSVEARLSKIRLLRLNGKVEQALRMLDGLVSDSPGSSVARLERAEILLSQNKEQAAKADIDAVLIAQPGSGHAIYLDAILAVKNKDFQRANNDLEKISRALPSIPRGYYFKALVDYNLGRREQAEDAARRHAARNPDDLAGEKLLGTIELALGRPAETIDALGRFESEGKADAGALDLLGRAYTQLGKTSEALRAFSAAVEFAPKDAALRTRLGGAQLRLGHTANAVTDLEASLELAPSAPAAEMLVLTELAVGHWDEAVDAAKKLEQAQPNSPVPGNLMGVISLARFNLDEARQRFADVTKKYPDFLPARLNLARVWELVGKSDEAEKILIQILSKDTANATALSRLVELSLRTGKPEFAITAVERAHAAAQNNQLITVGLIDLYIRQGANDKALTLARQENGNNDRRNFQLIGARARAEFAAGLKKEAAETYRRLIEIAPRQIGIRRQLATVLVSAGDVIEARQAIDQALQIDPRNPQLAADRIEIDLKSSGIAGAVATAEQLQSKYPDLPTAAALEGDAYMAAGESLKAAEAYAKALKLAPSEMLVIRLARAKSAAGDADAGTTILRDWLAAHADDVAVAEALANFDLAARRFEEATRRLEAVIQERPRDPVILNNLAWLYQRAGDPRARSLAERAYLLSPNVGQAGDTLGWILVEQGQPAIAISLLKQASVQAPKVPDIRYHLAVALRDIGQQSEARKILSELISGNADFDDKKAAEKLLAELSKD